jgi:hypothetical protein
MMDSIGSAKGYLTVRNFSPSHYGDGSWVSPHPLSLLATNVLPLISYEVIVSESFSLKSIRGSIRTLEEISPMLALMIVHEKEIEESLAEKGFQVTYIYSKIEHIYRLIRQEIATCSQRFEIMSEKDIEYFYELHL